MPRLPPGKLPNPGTEPRSPALQAHYLLSESPENPKNTGVGSLSLLQGTFPTQESNQSVLHRRRILYQLSRFSGVQPSAIPRTVARQAPLFMRFSTHWSGLAMPASRCLSIPGIEPSPPASPALQAESPGKLLGYYQDITDTGRERPNFSPFCLT